MIYKDPHLIFRESLLDDIWATLEVMDADLETALVASFYTICHVLSCYIGWEVGGAGSERNRLCV